MYSPAAHREDRLDVLHTLIRSHPLGTWAVADDDGIVINHLPFVLEAGVGELGVLRGHVARANPIWKAAPSAGPGAVVFRGPQTYITPSWYPSKHEHGKAVPTWNYAVVVVHGIPRFVEDRDWLVAHLETLTDTHEKAQALPWALSDAPEDFTAKMVAAIIGVEIPIQRIEGKWKVSQNRPHADKLGVVAGLTGKGDEASLQMAGLVDAYIPR